MSSRSVISNSLSVFFLFLFFFSCHFRARNRLMIFSLPRRAIFTHIAVDILAGTISIYFMKQLDTTPRPPTTIGITTHSQFHIRPSSTRRPLYFDIFSCSFSLTLISFGQETSIIKHFLVSLSLTTISGRLKTCGLC